MAFRLYVVPAIGDGSDDMAQLRRPKYIYDLQGPNYPNGMQGGWLDYGFQPVFLAGVDLISADDTAVAANADVSAFPFNLSSTVTAGQLATVQSKLEAIFIPGNWVTVGLSYLVLAKALAGMFRFMRRLYGFIGNTTVFDGTVNKNLDVQWQNIPQAIQDGMRAAAQIDYLDSSFVTPTTPVRQILKQLADQSQNMKFTFGPFLL